MITSKLGYPLSADFSHKKFGDIDVVVNNAGCIDIAAIEDATIENFGSQINTNLFGISNSACRLAFQSRANLRIQPLYRVELDRVWIFSAD